jgi:hypothetical protein
MEVRLDMWRWPNTWRLGGLGYVPDEQLRAGGVGAEHAGFGWREEFAKTGNNDHTVSEFAFPQRI